MAGAEATRGASDTRRNFGPNTRGETRFATQKNAQNAKWLPVTGLLGLGSLGLGSGSLRFAAPKALEYYTKEAGAWRVSRCAR